MGGFGQVEFHGHRPVDAVRDAFRREGRAAQSVHVVADLRISPDPAETGEEAIALDFRAGTGGLLHVDDADALDLILRIEADHHFDVADIAGSDGVDAVPGHRAVAQDEINGVAAVGGVFFDPVAVREDSENGVGLFFFQIVRDHVVRRVADDGEQERDARADRGENRGGADKIAAGAFVDLLPSRRFHDGGFPQGTLGLALSAGVLSDARKDRGDARLFGFGFRLLRGFLSRGFRLFGSRKDGLRGDLPCRLLRFGGGFRLRFRKIRGNLRAVLSAAALVLFLLPA